MFIHEVAYRLSLVQSRVAMGLSIGEALDRVIPATEFGQRTKHACEAYLVQAREQLPNGTASAVVRCARIDARQDGKV
jgi:hypothetical protein